jgi:iron complex outermembrane receptor protein
MAVLTAAGAALVVGTAWAQLVPPKPKPSSPVDYPAEGKGQSVSITLDLVVDANGKVEKATEKTREPSDAPELFVERAIAFAQTLSFEPAAKDGKSIKARIDYVVRFDPPAVAASASASSSSSVAPSPSASPSASAVPAPKPVASASASASGKQKPLPPPLVENSDAIELKIFGQHVPPPTSTSDFKVDADLLDLAPHASGGDLLSAAPGVYVGHVEGDAVANNIFLRGFDAEHGQDIELKVGALPINASSHIHGQGYADLGFVIPEVVRSVRVIEGVYDPRQGDFAVAGSAYFDLGVKKRGYLAKASYGSFGTRRLVGVWAPADEADETFGAFAYKESNGFGPGNRGSVSASGLAQYAFDLPAGYRMLLTAGAYGARATLPGVVRQDDYDAGRMGWFDTYPVPTALAQSAFNSRTQVGLEIDRIAETGAHLEFATYVMLTTFRLRENFTGFTQRGVLDPTRVGVGDLIEQWNSDTTIGASARYRSQKYNVFDWLGVNVEPGIAFRTSSTDQTQNLLQPPDNQIWDKRIDAGIHGTDLGAYLDLEARLFSRARLAGGVRADALYYDIDDRLGNFTPAFQKKTYEPGFRRTAFGVAYGPRGSLEIDATPWLQPVVSYGEGYRSPQARQLAEGERAPFTKVRSAEAGARIKIAKDRLVITTAAYQTLLSDDLAFDAAEGSLTKIGPTTRRGFVAYAVGRPWDWLLGSVSFTYVHATLDAPPPATAGDPSPAYTSGQLLPFVPPILLRADLGVRGALTKLSGHAVIGRIGGGYTYLGQRPLPHGQFASAFSLVDASGSVRWRELELGVEVFNLLDQRYADTELFFPSNWGTREIPSTLPSRHFVAGAPRTVLGSLTVHL